jgi:hypothetical protein
MSDDEPKRLSANTDEDDDYATLELLYCTTDFDIPEGSMVDVTYPTNLSFCVWLDERKVYGRPLPYAVYTPGSAESPQKIQVKKKTIEGREINEIFIKFKKVVSGRWGTKWILP